MISASEWKFFEGMEQRQKHLFHHAQENAWSELRGELPPWPPEDLATRQTALLQEMDYPARVEAALAAGPTPAEARHLELHRRAALRVLFETHPDLHPLMAEIRHRILSAQPAIEGRTILARDPDRARREAAWRAVAALGESLEPEMAELFRRRNLLAREVMDSGFPAVACYVHELDRPRMVGLLDELERFTRAASQEMKPAVARFLGVREVEPWDLDFALSGLEGVPAALPAASFPELAQEAVARWGLPDAPPLRAAFSDSVPRPIVLPVEIPTDVRVVAPSLSGLDAATEFTAAWGRALHMAHAGGRRHLLEHDSPAMIEATGFLLAAVWRDPAWLRAHAGLDGVALETYSRAARWRRILELRRVAARVAFENLVYAESNLEAGRLHADVMEQMMQDTRRRDAGWATDLFLVTHPLERLATLTGALIAAQLGERIAAEWPDPGERSALGPWLVEHVMAPGTAIPWEEKVEALTGRPLGIDALAADLRVEFHGPSLEETEEIGDDDVASYFEGIDLEDLDDR